MSDYGAIDLSGAIVTASGVAACRPRALTVYGSSTQDGTPTPSVPVPIVSVAGQLYQQTRQAVGTTYTISGLTFTYDSTNSATVSGTSTATAVAAWPDNVADDTLFVHVTAGTYTATSSHNVEVKKRVGTTLTTLVSYTTQRLATFTLAEDTDLLVVPVLSGSGVDFTGTRVWACLFAGFVPSVGVPYGHAGLWARGRNLLDPMAILATTGKGITITPDSDGWYNVSGTVTGTGAGVIKIADIETFVSDSVALSVINDGAFTANKVGIQVTRTLNGQNQYEYVYANAERAYSTSELTLLRFVLYITANATGTTVNGRFRLQLERGSTAHAYEPYTATVTPIPLDGHELRSLPDGTRDEVTVDERGHAVLVQRVFSVRLDGVTYKLNHNSGGYCSGSYSRMRTAPSSGAATWVQCDHFPRVVAAGGCYIANNMFVIRYGESFNPTSQAELDAWFQANPTTFQFALADAQVTTIDLGTIDPVPLCGPDLTAQTVPSTEFELTALLKTGRSTVMWDGEELSAGWTFVSDRREQLLPTDVATIDVPGRDGALFGGVTRAVRQVTLALYVLGPVGERAPHVRELAARLAVDGPRPLMFGDEAPLWRMAVPNAESESEVYYDAEGYTDVEFVCPDPWLYGEERSVTVPSGGSVTFTVGGTAPTWPTITASATGGSQGAWILRLDDSSKGVYASIASGVTRPVVADCDARTLTVNSVTSMLAPSYDWPELTPGTHTLAMTQGTGAVTVTWTERWW